LDYRQLPWIPIVAVLTLAAGLVFVLRTPRLEPAALPALDDATFEEIDAD
jgi:hypothetical protein